MPVPKHPKKEVREALAYATESGWHVNMSKTAKTRTYGFTLVLEGADVMAPENSNALHDAGCSDAMIGVRGGVQHAEFDREAPTFVEAVLSAIRDVENAVPGLEVVRLEPDDLVTASVIAKRMGRTRESVRLLFEGRRGPGSFPPPVAWIDSQTRVWQWREVARWFADSVGEDVSGGADAVAAAAINDALSLRHQAGRLKKAEAHKVLALVA